MSQNHQMAAAAATAAALAASQATGKPAAAAASVNPYPNRYCSLYLLLVKFTSLTSYRSSVPIASISYGSYAQAQAHAAQEAANHLHQYVSTSNALAAPVSTTQVAVASAAPQTSSPYANTFAQYATLSAQNHSLVGQLMEVHSVIT